MGRFHGGLIANISPSKTHFSLEDLDVPSPVNGIFDASIFERHLPTAAVLGEVMWVTSAPVNWAMLEPPPEELELILNNFKALV